MKSKIVIETGRVEHLQLTHQQSSYDTANKASSSSEFHLWKSGTTFIPIPVYKIQILQKKKLLSESQKAFHTPEAEKSPQRLVDTQACLLLAAGLTHYSREASGKAVMFCPDLENVTYFTR